MYLRFAGGHGDVGGGWEFLPDTKSASHIPLVYMIREAQKAGLNFDSDKLIDLEVAEELEETLYVNSAHDDPYVSNIRIDISGSTPPESLLDTDGTVSTPTGGLRTETADSPQDESGQNRPSAHKRFHTMIHKASSALIHDSLEFSSGLGFGPVLSWKMMEYMPFRRMDLLPNGHWKPIRWPLPCGETRDIPINARIHGSVIRRMQDDINYRPGNLIIGGGGRGVRRAPAELGTGIWDCVQERGDPVGEIWVKRQSQ